MSTDRPNASELATAVREFLEAEILPVLTDRPLSVIRVRPGQEPFMQKNVPKYTPDRVQTVRIWAEGAQARGPLRGL